MTEDAKKFCVDNELSIRAKFVPFSASRNAKPNPQTADLSINWRVTLVHKGRDVLTTDYMQGIAHLPGYKKHMGFNRRLLVWERDLLTLECESGRCVARWDYGAPLSRREIPAPDVADVLSCLLLDSEVIDYPAFEEWAETFGYNPDSRKEEALYRHCLSIALALRAGLGEDVLTAAREAFQDY